MQLYDSNGYVNIPGILEHPAVFIFIYGGRGTGKTYGALQHCIKNNVPFMYTRRLQSQADVLRKEAMQPFNKLNHDNNWSIRPWPENRYVAVFKSSVQNEDGKELPDGPMLGMMAALSTFASIRSIDASWIKLFIHDEFIPERTERPIKGEATALFNAYETLNRNRELDGADPIKLLCLANANDLANPVFMELGLVRTAEKMRKDGKDYVYLPKRRMLLIDLFKSEISEQKSHTALYELTKGTDFYGMAIKNVFTGEERGRIGHKPIKEYRPIVKIGEITIYRHKSKQEYYVTMLEAGSPPRYGSGEKDRERFRREYSYLWQEYMKNHIVFEEYLTEILFDRYFK